MARVRSEPPVFASTLIPLDLPLGRYIRLCREKKGWSRREFGKKMGITMSGVAQLENRESPEPLLSTTIRASRALGIPIEKFIEGVLLLGESEK